MDMVTVPKRVLDLLAQVQKYGTIARASELQEVYRLIAAHGAGAQGKPIPGSPAFSLRGLYKPAQEYFIDGKPATPEEYIDWQSRIIEAVTKAKLPDPKYYGTQDEDGNEHDVKCAYVDGWNQCRASILEVKPLAQMPLDDERNAFEAWAASKGHRFNDGDLNHCKSWALSAWLRRAEIAGAHPQPITDAARDVLIERAQRLLEGATWNLGGVLSSQSKASDIPSRASSAVKSRHLASLRDALAEIGHLDRAKGE